MTEPARYEATDSTDQFVACFGEHGSVRVTRSRERGYGGLDGSGEPHRACYQAVLDAVRAGRSLRVLDAGCGSGYGSDLLAAAGGHRVTGLDLSPEAVSFARRRAPAATFARGTCARLPFGDASFDLVINVDNIEHVPDPEAALAEFRRVLAPGGIYCVTTPCTWPGKDVSAFHVREYGKDDFEALLIRAGFAVSHWILERPYYFVLAQRDEQWGPVFFRAAAAVDPQALGRMLSELDLGAMPVPARRELLLCASEKMLAGGDVASALELASVADRVDVRGARAMLGLGRVAMAMGDLDSAMAAFREALERAPDSYPAWVAASEACERAGDGGSAMQAIETALGMAPADPAVVRVAVRLSCAAGDEERAGRIRDRARALGT